MQQLPERMRTILYLREIEEFSYQELAETLAMSLDQVKVTLHRARKNFASGRSEWKEEWTMEDDKLRERLDVSEIVWDEKGRDA